MYPHCHVDGVSIEVNFFFSNKYFNRKFPIFFKKIFLFHFFFFKLHFVFILYTLNPLLIHFPSCFTLSVIFQFVIPVYVFFLYIKGTIVKKLDLNFFRETLLELTARNLHLFKLVSFIYIYVKPFM